RTVISRRHAIGDPALDARDRGQAAIVGNVGRLRRPRRDRSRTWNDQQQLAGVTVLGASRSVGQNAIERLALGPRQLALELNEVPEIGSEAGDSSPGEVRQ